MIGNVSIFIEGTVRGEEESRIITKATGHYSRLDGLHILKYMESAVKRDGESDSIVDESLDTDEDCVNTIKISSQQVEMIKIGQNSTHMVFDLSRATQSIYDTPYGSLYFDIQTTRIEIEEKDKELFLNMEYSLSYENSHISDNHLYLTANTTIEG